MFFSATLVSVSSEADIGLPVSMVVDSAVTLVSAPGDTTGNGSTLAGRRDFPPTVPTGTL